MQVFSLGKTTSLSIISDLTIFIGYTIYSVSIMYIKQMEIVLCVLLASIVINVGSNIIRSLIDFEFHPSGR
jgi:hypothetical protein